MLTITASGKEYTIVVIRNTERGNDRRREAHPNTKQSDPSEVRGAAREADAFYSRGELTRRLRVLLQRANRENVALGYR